MRHARATAVAGSSSSSANRVSVIRSTSERQAAVEFAKAGAMRPRIVGAALAQIARDPELAGALFEVLETQQLLESPEMKVTVLPQGTGLLAELAAAAAERPEAPRGR